MSDNKILKTAGFMAAATLFAKFLGLVRDSMIAGFFGTGIEADAFMTASRLPTTLFDMVIGGVISATFIPVFNSVIEKQGRKQAIQFANKFITMILIITGLISVFGIIFAKPLTILLAPEYSGVKHELTVSLTTLMFPMIIFTGLAFSFVGLLQSFGEYKIPSLISLVSNIAIIIYFAAFGKRFGVKGLSVTMVIAWSLQVAVQIPSLLKFGFHYRPDFKLFDENIKNALLLAGPMLISTWVQPLYSVINSRLASGIDGAVSTLDYANRLYLMLTGVFSFVVTNLVFPKLAKANAANQKKEARYLTINSLKAILFVILPLMIGFIVLAKPVTSIIYERNNFTSNDVLTVSSALVCYSVGMLGLAINEIMSKVFFSIQDSKTPMINSIISMVFNIFLAYILFNYMKTSGLALAAAGGSICNAILNWFSMTKRFPKLMNKYDYISCIKIILSTFVMAISVVSIYKFISPALYGSFINNIVLCIICGFIGVGVYIVCCVLFRVDFVCDLFKKFRR